MIVHSSNMSHRKVQRQRLKQVQRLKLAAFINKSKLLNQLIAPKENEAMQKKKQDSLILIKHPPKPEFLHILCILIFKLISNDKQWRPYINKILLG